MWKWPVLALMLVACSGDADLEAPMLGDCSNCNTAPSPGGGISGGSDASIDAEAGDAADFDAAVSDEVNTPDGLDIVDVGVPTDIDALINP